MMLQTFQNTLYFGIFCEGSWKGKHQQHQIICQNWQTFFYVWDIQYPQIHQIVPWHHQLHQQLTT